MVFFVRLMRVFVLVALVLPLAACADFRNKCWPPIPHRAYEVCPQYDVSNPCPAHGDEELHSWHEALCAGLWT